MEFAMKELPDAMESSRGQQDCQPSVRQMNVDDFLEAVALDEILVDVLVSAGHSIVFGLFMQLEECYNRSKQYYDVNPSPDAERLIFEQLVNETKKILHRAWFPKGRPLVTEAVEWMFKHYPTSVMYVQTIDLIYG